MFLFYSNRISFIFLFFLCSLHSVLCQSLKTANDCTYTPDSIYASGNYEEAYESYLQCLRAIRNTDGDTSLQYHIGLLATGVCALEVSEYKKAGNYLQTAFSYFKSHNQTLFEIKCLQSLAALAKRRGDYGQAESQLLKILELNTENSFQSCSLKAITYNDLGVVYKRLGQFERAIYYLSESIVLKDSCLKKTDPSITISMNNLAGVYMKIKKYTLADSLYIRTIEIKTTLYGPNHPSTLIAINNLAELYRQQGEYSKALEILQDVLKRKEHTLGTKHPSYATTLYTIAQTYYASGNYTQAKTPCLQSIRIKKACLGNTHSSTLNGYGLLAKIYHASKNDKEAWHVYRFILENRKMEVLRYFQYLSEEEKITYIKKNSIYWKDFTRFICDIQKEHRSDAWATEACNSWIESRWYFSGMILEETQKLHRNWESLNDTLSKQQWKNLQHTKELIARHYLSEDKSSENIRVLEEDAARMEKALTMKSTVHGIQHYALKQVCQLVDSSECIVEIIKPFNDEKERYLALIYHRGIQTPHWIWLENTAVLEHNIYPYYLNTIRFNLENEYCYTSFWKPIGDYIAQYPSIRTIYSVREGVYAFVNPSTFFHSGSYTQDTYTFVSLNKTEDLIAYKKVSVPYIPTRVMLVYRPKFCEDGLACDYPDLPGTEQEAASISNIIPCDLYSGTKAEERIVKQAVKYDILHLATHGYFQSTDNGDEQYVESMIHSGLIFTEIRDTSVNELFEEDGLLSAYEFAQMDLHRTELVVLSACQSGLGKTDQQEGVLGLQRGIFVAGAKRVLTSLWAINDEVTAEWMSVFYRALLETNSYTQAYSMAQQSIRLRFPQPYYWGAFVLIEQ